MDTTPALPTDHVLSEPRQIQYPGGKDGFSVVDCSCGYSTAPTALPQHATLRAENHKTAKEVQR